MSGGLAVTVESVSIAMQQSFAHQDSFSEDRDNKTAGKDAEVLGKEGWRHDEARGADKERQEELLEVL